MGVFGEVCEVGAPTLAVVSVRLLSVVDLPDDGLPTRAMRGSRGIVFVIMTVFNQLAVLSREVDRGSVHN